MVSELPGGWGLCRLGEILELKYGKALPARSRDGGAYPVYGSNGIVGNHSAYLAEGPTVIVGRKGSVGEVCYSAVPCFPIDTTYYAEEFEVTHSKFIYYLLRNLDLASLNKSTAIPGLNRQDAYDLEIPLPPLAEQKRIAQKLDALLAQVDTLKARIDAMPALLKRFREATLTSAMSGTLTKDWRIESSQSTAPEAPRMCRQLLANERERIWRGRGKYKPAVRSGEVDASEFSNLPEVWHRGTLDEITWSVKDGPHFSPKYATDGVRFISGGNIRPGRIDLSTGKYISQELHEELSARCKPEYLDVLYTKGGTTGFAAVNRTESEFNVWVHVAVLKMLPPSVVDPFFVEFALNSPECYAQSQRYTHGVGNQDLGLRRMIKIVLPVPPIGEQREIVRRVEQLFAYADQLEAKVATAKQRIDALTQSLLAKAFRGELVPQDPAAEPASVLLDRIRAQRAATPKPKRGRKAATS
ncbi:restriction endonuclease subunit S [Xanthomonas oryzae]|uniref:restriction endonuclease subunit S n=1 Tax=Xanthomonas oryzae TaxID=347 RepID=UPI000949FCDF|nr:restriction endonuclease subunit S [Xanthomonas oryzae]UZK17884.1 restriction endonuclease subunit S [Xanthomonas oryzae pv. oryzae]